jgi:hypothetical protein
MNGALNDGLRYLVARWAELLDPQVHFSLSASSLVDPTVCITEFETTANDFLNNGAVHFETMLNTITTTREILSAERNFARLSWIVLFHPCGAVWIVVIHPGKGGLDRVNPARAWIAVIHPGAARRGQRGSPEISQCWIALIHPPLDRRNSPTPA